VALLPTVVVPLVVPLVVLKLTQNKSPPNTAADAPPNAICIDATPAHTPHHTVHTTPHQ
jgi:hypothetical protein